MRYYLLLILVFTFFQTFGFDAYAKIKLVPDKTRRNVEFDLHYDFLVTGKTSKIKLIVILPKNIPNRQKILKIKCSPKPLKFFYNEGIKYDEFGFDNPSGRIKVKVSVKAEIYKYDLSIAKKRKNKSLLLKSWFKDSLKHEKYIEVNDPAIKNAAAAISGTDEVNIVKNIYDYVIDNMQYGGYISENLGAVYALKNKKGDCSEYSDLFVALCRAKNIPAQVVTGYTVDFGITPKHAWAEVYLKDFGWVPFDPTWADEQNPAPLPFDKRNPIYVHFTHIRNDDTINNYSYSAYWYWGDKVEFNDSIVFK